MRKLISLMLSVVVLASSAACSPSGAALPPNRVAPVALSAEEQGLVNLLIPPDRGAVRLFEVQAGDACKSFDVWIEVYRQGRFTQRLGVLTVGGFFERMDGRLAIVAGHDSDCSQWSLRFVLESSGAGCHSDEIPIPLESDPDTGVIRMIHDMTGAEGVLDDAEAIIYVASFTAGTAVHSGYSIQQLQDEPELLRDYDCAIVVKCRFSTQELLVPDGATAGAGLDGQPQQRSRVER